MLRIYFVLGLIILAFYIIRKFIKTPPAVIALIVKKTGLFLLILFLVFLAVAGRLNWVFALISVLFAFSLRMLPWVARYMPQLHNIWMTFNQYRSSSSKNGKSSEEMTREEAYNILGLDSKASKEKIIMNHRKLIQKLHPDRGGSDYLATQINQARDVLLNNK